MSQPTRSKSFGQSSKNAVLLGSSLIVVAFAAYWPALHGGFIWDDASWTTGILNLLRNVSGLGQMWSDPTALQQYYPLSGTTFWLDYHFWKLWTLPYHIENVVLHLIAVLLFWKLLQKLEMPGAWLAAGIFALHPVMVESVAWITERKNVLSMVFFLGALLAYGRFNSFWKNENDSRRKWGAYALAFFLLLAALLSKTTTFSFPAVVLLVGWWKNGRIQWRRDVLPSLPFFAIAIGFSGVTAWLEKNHVGATGSDFAMTFPQRCLIAGRAFWFYLGKLFWPENLCFIYPRWNPNAGSFWQWLVPIAALAALAALWLARKKIGRGPATAVFFFAGTLFPVLGFMNAYGARYSFVWDHWVYLSSLGIFAFAAGLTAHLARHFKKPAMLFAFAAVVLPLLAILTWKQSAMYSNLETLWRTTIAKDPNAFLAYNNLGYMLMEKGQLEEAITDFDKSLEINPNFNEPHNNLGDALIRIGQTNEAVIHFKKAVELDPTSAASYYNLGVAWLEMQLNGDAIIQFQKALEFDPRFDKAYNNLGVALMRTGHPGEAMTNFQKAIEVNPEFADPHNNLANLLVEQNRLDEAIGHYQKAIQINPDYVEAHRGLASVLVRQDKTDEAIEHYQEVVRINPDDTDAHYNLGVLLALRARLDEAAEHFRKVIELKPDYADAHGNLANVLVGQGKLDEAVEQYQETIKLSPDSAQAHYKLGLALDKQKKFAAAVTEYEKTLDLDPRHLAAHISLAWLLATCSDASVRDGEKAVELALQSGQLSKGGSAQILDTLAAAYAEAGRFGEAV
ncbi:MAG TPA: tetratricopeptide repeat protein, partial [Verrucomicrobiae bacterium]